MEEKLKNCGGHRYAHQTVESTNCRADLIHVSNSEIYRTQWCSGLGLSRNQRGYSRDDQDSRISINSQIYRTI